MKSFIQSVGMPRGTWSPIPAHWRVLMFALFNHRGLNGDCWWFLSAQTENQIKTQMQNRGLNYSPSEVQIEPDSLVRKQLLKKDHQVDHSDDDTGSLYDLLWVFSDCSHTLMSLGQRADHAKSCSFISASSKISQILQVPAYCNAGWNTTDINCRWSYSTSNTGW